MKMKLFFILALLPIKSLALDIMNATIPTPPQEERSIFDFHTKEDFLNVIASDKGREFLSGRVEYTESKYHFGSSLERILKNSYGLAYTMPPSEEYQPYGDFVKDLCRKSIRGYSPSNSGVLELLGKLAKVHNYQNSSGFFVEEISAIENLHDFEGNDPNYEYNLSAFNDGLSFYLAACADTDSGRAFLQSFKPFLQDVSNEMEAYVKPRRERFVKEALAVKAQREEEMAALKSRVQEGERKKAAREQCMQSQAYGLYVAANGLKLGRATISNLRRQLQIEDSIKKESGAVNASKRYSLGKQIQETEEARKALFSNYRRLGGKASSMDEVDVPPNPCP